MNDLVYLVYIYNLQQVNFYISKGIVPLKTDIHRRTKKTFFVFKKSDTENAYAEWCGRAKTCRFLTPPTLRATRDCEKHV